MIRRHRLQLLLRVTIENIARVANGFFSYGQVKGGDCSTCGFSSGYLPGQHRRHFSVRFLGVQFAFSQAQVSCNIRVLSFSRAHTRTIPFRMIDRSIKLSSPRLNNMAAVGCGLVYGAVVLLGLDHATLPDSNDYYPTVCTVSIVPFLLSILRHLSSASLVRLSRAGSIFKFLRLKLLYLS